MFQKPAQITRHLTTAHLAQTMTLLSLTAEELYQKIDSELASNPALELIEERRCPTCNRLLHSAEPCPVCSRQKQMDSEEPIVFISPREDFFTGSAITKRIITAHKGTINVTSFPGGNRFSRYTPGRY